MLKYSIDQYRIEWKTKQKMLNLPIINIIFLYDRNPTPGVMINQPNGTNVYEGVKVDYRGDVSQFIWIIFLKKDNCICTLMYIDKQYNWGATWLIYRIALNI